jgi:hypothetical protein
MIINNIDTVGIEIEFLKNKGSRNSRDQKTRYSEINPLHGK